MLNTAVQDNTQNGINVDRTSNGAIFDSVISGNSSRGISVEWNSTVQMSGTEVTMNGGHGVVSFQESFINFFDPPNTIELNAGDDVRCNGGSGLFAIGCLSFLQGEHCETRS